MDSNAHVLATRMFVRRVLKDGTRTVEITEVDPGFERHMAQTIDEGIMVGVRH